MWRPSCREGDENRMIDIEMNVFNAVYDDVAPLCAENSFKGIHTPTPTAFPTVTLFELDNRTDRNRNSSSDFEDFAVLTYEAHVYATSKAKCRKVFKALDEALSRYNFNRFSGAYTPNLTNSKVHEYVARYQVRASNDGCLSRVN